MRCPPPQVAGRWLLCCWSLVAIAPDCPRASTRQFVCSPGDHPVFVPTLLPCVPCVPCFHTRPFQAHFIGVTESLHLICAAIMETILKSYMRPGLLLIPIVTGIWIMKMYISSRRAFARVRRLLIHLRGETI